MRKSNFTDSQSLAILAEQDAGQSVEEICRKHQISPATFYADIIVGRKKKWRSSKTKINVDFGI